MNRDRSKLSDSDRKVYEDVESHGWHVVKISEDANTSGWAFTVGLYATFGHPEVVLFGLREATMHQLLNFIGEGIRAGKAYEQGKAYTDVIENYECRFESVDRAWYRPFLGMAQWFYEGQDFPVLQCVWPDQDGKWPWECPGDLAWSGVQPVLSRPEPGVSGAAIWLDSMGLSTIDGLV